MLRLLVDRFLEHPQFHLDPEHQLQDGAIHVNFLMQRLEILHQIHRNLVFELCEDFEQNPKQSHGSIPITMIQMITMHRMTVNRNIHRPMSLQESVLKAIMK